MIILTRLNGDRFALNSDLVERIDVTPDTVLTLVDSTKYVVVEGLEEIVGLVRDFRASVVARAGQLAGPVQPGLEYPTLAALRLVHREER